MFVVFVFVLTFLCAVPMIRRGERREGVILGAALVIVVLQHLVDVVRDTVGGSWPYVLEFGLATWGVIMSIELAIDFGIRRSRLSEALANIERGAGDLARSIETSLHVRDQLNTPLQTLELGLQMWTARGAESEQTLADMARWVAELTKLGRAVEKAADQGLDAQPQQERNL